MKKIIIIPALIALFIFGALFFNNLIITNPIAEDCTVIEITVNDIREGTSSDIVFKDDATDFYYINRGLERGLNVDGLKQQLLNKKVTLHLPKFMLGTTEHIAQLAIGDDVIFTEFE